VFGSAGTVALATLAWHESGANGAVLERLGFNERHQRPTAWDYWFGQRFESRLKISFADGTTVWGYYGRDSFASYAKDGRDLYLEGVYRERIVLEDEADDEAGGPWFGRSHPNSCGAWLNLDDAVRIEFYDLDDGGTTEETSTKQTDRARAKDRRPAATQEQGSSKETPATSAPAEEV
jgi:hypothetical protein